MKPIYFQASLWTTVTRDDVQSPVTQPLNILWEGEFGLDMIFSRMRAEGILLDHDFTNQSLREVKQATFGIRWSRARQKIQALPASATMRALAAKPAAGRKASWSMGR